jgi:hypothetical protein
MSASRCSSFYPIIKYYLLLSYCDVIPCPGLAKMVPLVAAGCRKILIKSMLRKSPEHRPTVSYCVHRNIPAIDIDHIYSILTLFIILFVNRRLIF